MDDGRRPLRVLFLARQDALAFPAGDTVHLTETRVALAALGVETGLELASRPAAAGWDVVHLFNLLRADHAFLQAEAVAGCGPPLVVTPLYWNVARLAGDGAEVSPAWLGRWEGEQRLRRRVLARAAAVLVSGLRERWLLEEDFGPLPVRVVPVGVPRQALRPRDVRPGDEREGEKTGGERDVRDDGNGEERASRALLADAGLPPDCPFVLTVGRISPHKNQLGLIRALRGTDLRVVAAGPVHDGAYLARCRREGGRAAFFLGPVAAPVLRGLYGLAGAHVLPSWCELPGLSTLEAALHGRPVVITERGTALEYVGREAGVFPCDPAEPESIRRSCLRAVRAAAPASLRRRVLSFTWERAAASLVSLYRSLAGAAGPGAAAGGRGR